ncbi:Membrane fusion protein (MFP) family protein [Alphaproteobacteria bacterium]
MNAKKNKLIDWKGIKIFFSDLKDFLFASNIKDAKYKVKIEQDLVKHVRPATKFGFITIVVIVGIFGVWAGTAPLDSAASAQGHIVLSGTRKTIQHEGGIIDKILVKDGDFVEEGQALIIMNQVRAKSELEIMRAAVRTHLAVERRTLAEQNDAKSIDFLDEAFLDPKDPEVQAIIKNQENIFLAKRQGLEESVNVYTAGILQEMEMNKGHKEQLKNTLEQLELEKKHWETTKILFDKGLVKKVELVQASGEYQRYQSNKASLQAQIAATIEKIGELKARIMAVKSDYYTKVAEEYNRNHPALLESQQKYLHTKDQMERTVVKSPIKGIVTGLKVHTLGSLVGSGPLMDIISQDDDLIVEAYVAPQEINHLKVGMRAKVTLNPYKQRLVPRVEGEVIYVSADRIANEQIGRSTNQLPEYFLVKIKIEKSTLEKLNTEVKLYPGMPVTVFLIRGTRTVLQYLISPITDSFHKAFKEQ